MRQFVMHGVKPLRGTPLTQLSFCEAAMADLTPLAGMPLESLGCQSSNVTDLTQIKDLPIKSLWLDFQPARDTALLRSLPTLESINDKPVAEFWKDMDGKSGGGTDSGVRRYTSYCCRLHHRRSSSRLPPDRSREIGM